MIGSKSLKLRRKTYDLEEQILGAWIFETTIQGWRSTDFNILLLLRCLTCLSSTCYQKSGFQSFQVHHLLKNEDTNIGHTDNWLQCCGFFAHSPPWIYQEGKKTHGKWDSNMYPCIMLTVVVTSLWENGTPPSLLTGTQHRLPLTGLSSHGVARFIQIPRFVSGNKSVICHTDSAVFAWQNGSN